MEFVINIEVSEREPDGRVWRHALNENVCVSNFEWYAGTWPGILKRITDARLHNRFQNAEGININSVTRFDADGICHEVDPAVVINGGEAMVSE